MRKANGRKIISGMKLKNKIIAFILPSLVVGWFSHYYYNLNIANYGQEIVQIRENSSANKFINPLILVADNRKIEFEEYKELKNRIGDYINKSKNSNITDVSYYFRDLNSGEWIGVNENAMYSPSRMLKVITLIAYSKLHWNF